jgi:type VI secretion system secreted protein Hcp
MFLWAVSPLDDAVHNPTFAARVPQAVASAGHATRASGRWAEWEQTMPIYMGFFDAPNVLNRSLRGDVTAKGYEGWIELQSAQLGASRSISTPTAGKGAGKVSVSEITVTKLQDAASSALFRQSLHGEGKMIVIVFVKDGSAYMTIVLRDALISSYSVSGHGGASSDRPMESLSLNFTQITYNTQDKSPDVTRQAQQKLGPWEQSTLGEEAQ